MEDHPSQSLRFLSLVDSCTQSRIQRISGSVLNEKEFSVEYFYKIKESLIDIQVLVSDWRININSLIDYYSILRCLNVFVYKLDELAEHDIAFNPDYIPFEDSLALICSECISTFGDTNRLLDQIKDWISKHKNFVAKEVTAQRLIRSKQQLGDDYFKLLFERLEGDYIDTGYYGRLLLECFKAPRANEFTILSIWNTRCRVLDLIDGLIDLNEDIRSRTASPLGIYIYNIAAPEDRALISEAIVMGDIQSNIIEVFQPYCFKLLNYYRSFLTSEGVSSRFCDKLLNRSLQLLDIAERLVVDPYTSAELESFYTHTILNIDL